MSIVSPSPHIHANKDTKKIMYQVVLALIPALIVSIIYFGIHSLIAITVASVTAVLTEWIIQKFVFKTKTLIKDGSALLTGLLLAFNLPSTLPLYMIVLGSIFAIGVGKLSFGGLGSNPFNPALVGRVFLLISFPAEMTSWPLPSLFNFMQLDGKTGATTLTIIADGVRQNEPITEILNKLPNITDLILGNCGGSLGEISVIALTIGGLYLILKKIISWHVPISFLITLSLTIYIINIISPNATVGPLLHLISGGAILGAFFMATDMVTSPISKSGMILFGAGCGLLTAIIRVYGSYPEGASFAILLMNSTVPLINRQFTPKRFGQAVKI